MDGVEPRALLGRGRGGKEDAEVTTTYDPNAFLMGGGARSARFETVGDTVIGLVTSMEMRQQTDFKTNELLFWQDGNPRMQLVVTLETMAREDADDDGLRNVYIKGQMQKAVADAIKRAGERGIGQGGKLGIKFVATATPTDPRLSGAKQYTASYAPPVVTVPNGDDGDLPF